MLHERNGGGKEELRGRRKRGRRKRGRRRRRRRRRRKNKAGYTAI